MPFIYFSLPFALARTSVVLNSSGENRHPSVSDLRGKARSFSSLSMSAVGFLLDIFCRVEEVPFYPCLLGVFIRNECQIVSNAFPASLRWSCGFSILVYIICACFKIYSLLWYDCLRQFIRDLLFKWWSDYIVILITSFPFLSWLVNESYKPEFIELKKWLKDRKFEDTNLIPARFPGKVWHSTVTWETCGPRW